MCGPSNLTLGMSKFHFFFGLPCFAEDGRGREDKEKHGDEADNEQEQGNEEETINKQTDGFNPDEVREEMERK